MEPRRSRPVRRGSPTAPDKRFPLCGESTAATFTKRGLVRTLAFPLSFLLLGLGFVGILLGRDRCALHDVIAGTAVVYDWDAREARLRSLAREGSGRRP